MEKAYAIPLEPEGLLGTLFPNIVAPALLFARLYWRYL